MTDSTLSMEVFGKRANRLNTAEMDFKCIDKPVKVTEYFAALFKFSNVISTPFDRPCPKNFNIIDLNFISDSCRIQAFIPCLVRGVLTSCSFLVASKLIRDNLLNFHDADIHKCAIFVCLCFRSILMQLPHSRSILFKCIFSTFSVRYAIKEKTIDVIIALKTKTFPNCALWFVVVGVYVSQPKTIMKLVR